MVPSGLLAAALCWAALPGLVASVRRLERYPPSAAQRSRGPPSAAQSSADLHAAVQNGSVEEDGTPPLIPAGAFEEYGVPAKMPKTAMVTWTGRRWTPMGWVYKRTPGQRAYFDIHIPKTAGCSWSIDVKQVLAPGVGYHSYESCYYAPVPLEVGDAKVALLRDPVMHVYSQYLECKYDGWARHFMLDEDKPKMQSVTTWLRHFEGGAQHYDLRCYHPYNMQARALVCRSLPHHYVELDGLQEALSNLDSLGFVGIVEHYQASLCLFSAKTQPGRPLPKYCDCTDRAAWATFAPTRVSHKAPPHSISNLTQEDLSMIAELTKIDRPLYEHALERFRREADEVARATGTRILC